MIIILLILGLQAIYKANSLIYMIDRIKINQKSNALFVSIIYILLLIYVYVNYDLFHISMFSFLYLILYYVALIDKDIGIIPDKYNILILLIGLIRLFIIKAGFLTILYSIMPIVLLIVLVLIVETLADGEVMGGGDLKLLFVLSLALGLENILFILFLSNLFFIFRKKRKKGVSPFAPYIFCGYIGMFLLSEMFIRLLY